MTTCDLRLFSSEKSSQKQNPYFSLTCKKDHFGLVFDGLLMAFFEKYHHVNDHYGHNSKLPKMDLRLC